MHSAITRVGIIATTIAVTLTVAGCTAIAPSSTNGPAPAEAQTSSAEQSRDSACTTVNAEWGFALDPWLQLEADTTNKDFAHKQAEHNAVISTLQDISDRVEVPEVREALNASISAHQEYADTVWPALGEVPEGYVVDLEDPTNLLVILGEQTVTIEQQMSDADVQRYDLCGVMQSSQTAAQACAIADGDWVDASLVFNDASTAGSRGDVAEAKRLAAESVAQLKAAMVQVTVPEVSAELVRMYDAYETYVTDVVTPLLTEEEARQLPADELDAYIANSDDAFAVWDKTLTAGEKGVADYCGSQG
ncbi:MAG: hypothetical protein ACTJHU_08240 [Mycetocola sp.]